MQNAAMEVHDRLKVARQRAGFVSAADAARRLGIPYGTYSGHENGGRGLKASEIERYAAVFGVTPAWLSFGTPSLSSRISILGIVGAGGIISPRNDAFIYVDGIATDDFNAYYIGRSAVTAMFEKADIILTRKNNTEIAKINNGFAILKLQNDKIMLKEVTKIEGKNRFNLYYHNSNTIGDVSPAWARPVFAIIKQYSIHGNERFVPMRQGMSTFREAEDEW